MVDSTPISNFYPAGRTTAAEPHRDRLGVGADLDGVDPFSYVLDFTIVNQSIVIGTIRSMFVDNSSNPSEIEVSVSLTNQFFTIPAFAEGYFLVNAQDKSTITLTSDGGADDKISTVFFNYTQPPQVWYRFGPFNDTKPIKVKGAEDVGTVMATSDAPQPVFVAGIKTSDGSLTPFEFTDDGKLSVDATFTGDVTIESPSNGDITLVPSAIVSTTILLANVDRKGALIFNDSTEPLQLALENVDAVVNYSIVVQPGDTFALGNGDYTGQINGAWTVANGNARVTELTV